VDHVLPRSKHFIVEKHLHYSLLLHCLASVAKKTAILATPCFGWEECTLQRRQCHPVISVILKVDEQTESQEIEPTIMKLTKWQSAELIRRLALEALGTTN